MNFKLKLLKLFFPLLDSKDKAKNEILDHFINYANQVNLFLLKLSFLKLDFPWLLYLEFSLQNLSKVSFSYQI